MQNQSTPIDLALHFTLTGEQDPEGSIREHRSLDRDLELLPVVNLKYVNVLLNLQKPQSFVAESDG